ncbi:MAG: GFA family protein [Lysobacteraceae bacterium]|nr:MAG: GFA family protein [Xanthomonadaceae bacterium]
MHEGSCHCGAVRYAVEGTPEKAIECNCSHCQRKGLLLWFVPRDALAIREGGESLAEYTFNKRVIRHQFCPTCGVQPFSFGQDKSGAEMAAINVRCLEGVDLDAIERVPVNGKDF